MDWKGFFLDWHTFDEVLFFPDGVREVVIVVRADKREPRDPIGLFLLVVNKLSLADRDGLMEVELFSLSLELRSIETVRLVVDLVLSKKIRMNKS